MKSKKPKNFKGKQISINTNNRVQPSANNGIQTTLERITKNDTEPKQLAMNGKIPNWVEIVKAIGSAKLFGVFIFVSRFDKSFAKKAIESTQK